MSSVHLAYQNYWERKRLLTSEVPSFPVKRWWGPNGFGKDGLCEIEKIYFDGIKNSKSLLDVGAGDLRVKKKFQAAGYEGEYHTMDWGGEYPHTYRDLAEIKQIYNAILCFDVIEHMTLGDGLGFLEQMLGFLAPGGILVLQTPNSRCVRFPLAWDMTHVHCYNLPDLWAYFKSQKDRVAQVDGYRVVFSSESISPLGWLRNMISRFFITRVVGCDYADNIALMIRKGGL